MQYKLILFDIGNTHIKIGIANAKGVIASYALNSDRSESSDSLGLKILQVLQNAECSICELKTALASSVVPDLNFILLSACKRYLKLELLFIPTELAIPMENRYARPEEVGADRLLGAFAARKAFPEYKNIISIDFGTATTFDCIENNAYLGGLICPGIYSSASALTAKAAKLPRISLMIEENEPIIGKSTSTSLNHGFIFGFAAMTEGLCNKIAETMPSKPLIIATGGFATALAKVTNCFDQVYPELLLDGLFFLCKEHRLI
ncbi:type III pantothenate kinase [Desulfovibrio litoralis]|uniref:Type III pantothenate kinase n=1 Tax=Desulfovibrio litoralis DSM 11393 TaxID=1121455 RepID=A0A1M7SL69_9BACT|nr:type III pantothenate kinase [Desulfovibrio litoralis]SHN59190.1 pantothenate kinase [Desulfovibrio litoralis DSM 11393]